MESIRSEAKHSNATQSKAERTFLYVYGNFSGGKGDCELRRRRAKEADLNMNIKTFRDIESNDNDTQRAFALFAVCQISTGYSTQIRFDRIMQKKSVYYPQCGGAQIECCMSSAILASKQASVGNR